MGGVLCVYVFLGGRGGAPLRSLLHAFVSYKHTQHFASVSDLRKTCQCFDETSMIH